MDWQSCGWLHLIEQTTRTGRPRGSPNRHQPKEKLITICRGGSGDDVVWGPLWPPVFPRWSPVVQQDRTLATGDHKGQLYPSQPPSPSRNPGLAS
ncbi:MAG TPA: hypothetical protein VK140_17020 [Ktedonobacteraceae bacterium]|nr:hypothetical protein [Ktedonobacteraceae bacterium]